MSHPQPHDTDDSQPHAPPATTPAHPSPPAPDILTRLKLAISGIGPTILGPGVENHMPVDHFQVTREGTRVATTITRDGEEEAIGRYSAPSKLGVYLSTLFHLAQANPMLNKLHIQPDQALHLMISALRSYRHFQQDQHNTHSKAGFTSWYEWDEHNPVPVPVPVTIDNEWKGDVIVPILDNGEARMPIEAISGAFSDSDDPLKREVLRHTQAIVQAMDYGQMVNGSADGRLYSQWNVTKESKIDSDEPEYGWTEWAIPHLDAYLDRDTIDGPGKITRKAWTSLYTGTVTWESPAGPIDIPKLHTWSLHELWIIQYLGPIIMKSKQAQFYYNLIYYLTYCQKANNNVGGLSTEYGHTGYNAAGQVMLHGEDRAVDPDQAVPFGTVFEGLVYPPAIAWADYLFDARWATSRADGTGCVVKKYGPVTSFRRGNVKPELGAGPSQFYTWDNTGGTANGLAEWYLMAHASGSHKCMSLSEGYVRAKARRWKVPYEDAETAVIRALNEIVEVIEERWQTDPGRLSDSVRGPKGDRESYRAQVIERNEIRAKYGLAMGERGRIMAADPSQILLPPEKPDFRVFEAPWPESLVAEDLNLADYLTRSERHAENIVAPEAFHDSSWMVDKAAKWLLRDGEFIADYSVAGIGRRALIATFLGPAVPLAVYDASGVVRKYQCLSLWVNIDGFRGRRFTVRLWSNSLAIAVVECDPQSEGGRSSDGRWRRVVAAFANDRLETTIEEREYCNKIDFVVEKPLGTSTLEGRIHVRGVQLHVAPAIEVREREVHTQPGASAHR
jgi:hypothetical protein